MGDKIWINEYKVSGHYRRHQDPYDDLLTPEERSELTVLREMVEAFRVKSDTKRRWSMVSRVTDTRTAEEIIINVDDLIMREAAHLRPTSWGYQLLKLISLFYGDQPFSLRQIYSDGERILQQLHPRNTVIRSNIRFELQQLQKTSLVTNNAWGIWQRNF